MSNALPDGYVVHLPPPLRQVRLPHKFGDPVSVPGTITLSRHPQTERTCTVCGAVKVTVHRSDGIAWREWRKSASDEQVATEMACEPLPVAKGTIA
jgi:hypothetical protein